MTERKRAKKRFLSERTGAAKPAGRFSRKDRSTAFADSEATLVTLRQT